MPTTNQTKSLEKSLREYRKRYLRKEFADVDESATRIMVNTFLTEVLGYKELEDIKTEHRIKGQYADYVIQLNRKKQIVIEVKSISIDLDNRHLRQSVNYAANEGIDWVLLFNGRNIALYRVIFEKPIDSKLVFDFDLRDLSQVKKAAEAIAHMSKNSVVKGDLEKYWQRCKALEPESLARQLYSEEVAKYLRRALKKETGIYFDTQEISENLKIVIKQSFDIDLRYKK